MSHCATNWAIHQRGLKPATKIVLWYLADCHNRNTGRCDAAQDTIAAQCEMDRSTVNCHLKALEKHRLIRRVKRPIRRPENSLELNIYEPSISM